MLPSHTNAMTRSVTPTRQDIINKFGQLNKENEMGWACSTHGGDEKLIQNVTGKQI
jgi:hypothetical protein